MYKADAIIDIIISNTSTVTFFPPSTCSGSHLHFVLLGDDGEVDGSVSRLGHHPRPSRGHGSDDGAEEAVGEVHGGLAQDRIQHGAVNLCGGMAQAVKRADTELECGLWRDELGITN